ncbi:TraY domain-containing protein [Photobacterium damselae]|uniref:TraY domain-containing protein n=1 Tax=Photobacterium damselae TaxID=38293 RepID=UPI000B97669B|nr:TraY domain-containing protein [Photobacterium damselae]
MTTNNKEKLTSVNVLVGVKGNALLNHAAFANHRSKRKEAAARLEHHLRTFGSNWTECVKKER